MRQRMRGWCRAAMIQESSDGGRGSGGNRTEAETAGAIEWRRRASSRGSGVDRGGVWHRCMARRLLIILIENNIEIKT